MKKTHVCLTLFILLGLVLNNTALCWDDKTTHMQLSEYAGDNSVLDKNKGDYLRNLGFVDALDTRVKWGEEKPIKKWLQDGAKFEDAGSNTQGFLGLARYNNHFHNPLKPWGSAGLNDVGYTGESTILWSQYGSWQASYPEGDWSWGTTRNFFYKALSSKTDAERQENFAKTFRGLGHQMHLIQDMSVPAHVKNDAHPEDSLLEFNRLTGDYYFETWAKKYYPRINSFASSPAFPNVDLNISRNGLAPISQFIDSEQYNENVVPSKSLNWGLSEYTSSNFVSTDTIFTENFSKSDGHYFPYPRYVDQNQCYEQYEQAYGFENKKRTYWRKKCLGEPVDHFVTVGPLFKYLPNWDLQRWEIKLDEATHNDYASKLIPRAVGYSAGLLNYFFRGDIDMVPDDATGSGYVIMNNSDEDMNGTFELYYDNTSEQRIKIWSGNFTIGKKNSGINKSTNIIFSSPPDAMEPNKYMLVFKGKLGNEESAVVGKNIKLPEKVFLFLVSYDEDIYSLSKSVFEVRAEDNQYRLLAMPQSFAIPIQTTDPASYNYTVQSTDGNTKHSFSYPGSFWMTYRGFVTCDYKPELRQYGVALPSGYYKNEYQCHYGSVFISMPGNNWWLKAKDGNYSLDSFGRHNYTLDSSGNISTFNDSIWRENSVGCTSNYVYRYKAGSSGSYYVNGGIVASDQLGSGNSMHVPEQGLIECQGPAVVNTVVAALGKGAAFVYQNTDNRPMNQYAYETIWEYSQDNCTVGLYKGTSTKIKTSNQDIKIGGQTIDSADTKRKWKSHYFSFGGAGSCSDSGAINAVLEEHYQGGSYSYESESTSSDTGLKIMDYDNINGDEMYMVLYSKMQSVHSQINSALIEISKGGQIRSTDIIDSTTIDDLKNDLYLAYKTPSSAMNKILLYTIDNPDYKYDGVSCQMTKDMMTYTYIVKKKQGYVYIFDKRIIGVVNISDVNLPIGYRKELVIDNENYPVGDFNFTQGAGIGIHKGMQ